MNNHYLSANNASGDPTQRARNRTCGLQARFHADADEAQRGKTNSLEEEGPRPGSRVSSQHARDFPMRFEFALSKITRRVWTTAFPPSSPSKIQIERLKFPERANGIEPGEGGRAPLDNPENSARALPAAYLDGGSSGRY